MSGHMHTSHLPRRASRTSAAQPTTRPARVEKPKSHHNSPRAMERRRTTTTTTTTEPKRYATLDDHYRMMFGVEPEEACEERSQSSRPVSWHPSSTQRQPQPTSSYFDHHHQNCYPASPCGSTQGSDFYSLSTRNSMFEPSSHHASRDWQSTPYQTPSHAQSTTTTTPSEPLPWYLHQWAQKNQEHARAASHNRSMDFLPVQHPPTHDDQDMEDGGEKLVALGLYDLPEPSLSWEGIGAPSTGKGLKLEETWQPPAADDDDDDDEAGHDNDDDADVEDDASSEASEEPSPPLPSVDECSQQLRLPVHVKTHTPGSMDGQSFFFDDDETVSKEWWFQQAKQPSMPVRGHGLAYGWL
ncbi:hypothetical protein ACEQ8H_002025 [Pleosporales sp. CAS-2024a]